MARQIVNLISWGILFLSLGTIGDIALEVMGLAAKGSRTGLISLVRINKLLQ